MYPLSTLFGGSMPRRITSHLARHCDPSSFGWRNYPVRLVSRDVADKHINGVGPDLCRCLSHRSGSSSVWAFLQDDTRKIFLRLAQNCCYRERVFKWLHFTHWISKRSTFGHSRRTKMELHLSLGTGGAPVMNNRVPPHVVQRTKGPNGQPICCPLHIAVLQQRATS